MKKRKMDESATHRKPRAPRGFSLLELIIVVAVIGIISTVAVVGITRSRNSVNLQSSARLFASYVEKARVDAIRRHGGTNIDIAGPNTYVVTMDFDGTGGTPVPRTFTLERGVVFTDSTNTAYTVDGSGAVSSSNGEEVSLADFNWRGRTARCSMLFRMQNSNNERSVVQVAGSGDVTIDTVISSPASVTTTNVNTSADVAASAVVNGPGSYPELNPCSVGGGGGTSIPPPVATCVGNTIRPDYGSYTVRKNGASTATVNVTATSPGTIYATSDSNLRVMPTSQSVTSSTGGTFAFTISSITKLRFSNPPLTVVFSNPCGSFTVYVTVTN